MPPALSLPALTDLLGSARVVSLPLVSRFRRVDVREALLLEGPSGWTEFSPFTEYGDAEASAWLAAALDFGWGILPPLVRGSVAVNATLPAVGPFEVAEVL